MSKTYYHYSERSNLEPVEERDHTWIKPVGLWITDDSADNWPNWCRKQNYPCGTHLFQIDILPNSNLRWVTSAEELDIFTEKYSTFETGLKFIDWKRVIDKYNGLMIFPYLHSRRYEHMWYYGWDCASGCLWNPQACIERVTYLGEHRLRCVD